MPVTEHPTTEADAGHHQALHLADLERMQIRLGRNSLEFWDRLVQAEQTILPLEERLAGAQRAMELLGRNRALLKGMRGMLGFADQLAGAKVLQEQAKGVENAVRLFVRDTRESGEAPKTRDELLRRAHSITLNLGKMQSASL